MELKILTNVWGNWDPKGDQEWIWRPEQGGWWATDNTMTLPPADFKIDVLQCEDCEGSKCGYCGKDLPGDESHMTLLAPGDSVTISTCGKTECNTLIANIIDPVNV